MKRHDSPVYPLHSMRKLEALLGRSRGDIERMAGCAGRYYRPFDQRPVGGSKWRHIDQSLGELKSLQKRIHRSILSTVFLPDTMLGSSPGRCLTENLEIHTDTPFVLGLDLRSCYPRTSHRRVFRLYRELFGASERIASALTKLTTFQHRVPQGAPSSPTLVNLSLLPLHREILSLASQIGAKATFWVDDITISGARAPEMIESAIRAIMRHGHSVRRSKIRLMPASTRQVVPGGVVNSKASAGHRLRVQPLRDEILDLASHEAIPQYRLVSIRGSIQQITGLCQSQGESLMRLAERILPAYGKPGRRPPKYRHRRCTSARHHSKRRRDCR